MNKKSIAKECINVILLLINIKIPSIVYDYYFKYSEGPYLQIAVIVEYSLTCIAWMILILYIIKVLNLKNKAGICLLYTSPSPRDSTSSRMPSSA